jgi:hypothetical protein
MAIFDGSVMGEACSIVGSGKGDPMKYALLIYAAEKDFAGMSGGALVWLSMDFVVLRLAGKEPASPAGADFWQQLAIHVVCVGAPIALTVLRPSERQADPRPEG